MHVQTAQRGVAALMAVLFLVFMLGVVLLLAHQMAATDVYDSGAQNNSVEALFLAETGVERAAWRFTNGTACSALAEAAILHGRGQFTIAAGQSTDFNGAALPGNQCRLRATGQITGTTVARTIEGIAQSGASARVQSGTITMNPAAQTVTIPSAVNTNQSFVVCQNRTNLSNASSRVTCNLTGPTTLTITAGAANANNTVQWYVVEFFSGVTVQRGETSFAAGGGTSSTNNITLPTAVNLGQTFVLTSERMASANQDQDERWTTTATLTSTTNLQLQRAENGTAMTVAWQVIQMTGATVQAGTTTISGNNNFSATVTLGAAVTPESSFLVFTRRGRPNVNGRESNYQVRGELTNATTLTFTRNDDPNPANRAVDISWFLVSLADGTTVQRGTGSVGTNTDTQNIGITSIDTTRSVPFLSASGGPGGNDNADLDSTSWAADFTSPTNLRLRRGPSTGLDAGSQAAWFVVQFSGASSIVQWREAP